MVASVVGFWVVAASLLWLMRGRIAGALQRRTLLALAVFTLYPAHLRLPSGEALMSTQPGSAYRWSVSWPSTTWRVRHELALPARFTGSAATLTVMLAGPYSGTARVFATANGMDIGKLRPQAYDTLVTDVPASIVQGQSLLTIELWPDRTDPALRLAAQRWDQGATLAGRASSYFDSQRWWPGTFDDQTGQPRPGMYVIRLDVRS